MSQRIERETGVRTVYIDGVPVSISNEKGAALFWGQKGCQGKTIRLEKRYGSGFVPLTFKYNRKGKFNRWVAVSPRLDPGEYYTTASDVGIYGLGLVYVTVSSTWVSEIDWRRA